MKKAWLDDCCGHNNFVGGNFVILPSLSISTYCTMFPMQKETLYLPTVSSLLLVKNKHSNLAPQHFKKVASQQKLFKIAKKKNLK